MKDHVEIGHLTKYDAFRVNRDQVMNLPNIKGISGRLWHSIVIFAIGASYT